jgi:hypothetical protein
LREPLPLISSPLDECALLAGRDGRWNGNLPQASFLLNVLLNMEVTISTPALREAALKCVLNRVAIIRHSAVNIPTDSESLDLGLYRYDPPSESHECDSCTGPPTPCKYRMYRALATRVAFFVVGPSTSVIL